MSQSCLQGKHHGSTQESTSDCQRKFRHLKWLNAVEVFLQQRNRWNECWSFMAADKTTVQRCKEPLDCTCSCFYRSCIFWTGSANVPLNPEINGSYKCSQIFSPDKLSLLTPFRLFNVMFYSLTWFWFMFSLTVNPYNGPNAWMWIE